MRQPRCGDCITKVQNQSPWVLHPWDTYPCEKNWWICRTVQCFSAPWLSPTPPGVNGPPFFTSSTPIHRPAYCPLVSVPLLPLKAVLAKNASAILVYTLRELLSPFTSPDPSVHLAHLPTAPSQLSDRDSSWLLLLCLSISFLLNS